MKGRDSVAGLPKTIHITSQEIREALSDTIANIVDAVRVTLERCPPELSADLVDRGFVLAGGGALIRGIDRLLSEKTGLPVTVSDDPLSAVANGTGAVLNDLNWVMQNTAVLHFCGKNKPWNADYKNPFGMLYLHYMNLTTRKLHKVSGKE